MPSSPRPHAATFACRTLLPRHLSRLPSPTSRVAPPYHLHPPLPCQFQPCSPPPPSPPPSALPPTPPPPPYLLRAAPPSALPSSPADTSDLLLQWSAADRSPPLSSSTPTPASRCPGHPLSLLFLSLRRQLLSGGLQIGGGINSDNAMGCIEQGASHVIVTSYAFNDGEVNLERLQQLVRSVGKNRLVLDLSCRKKNGKYAIVTNRWQKFTDVFVEEKTLGVLSTYADEFLVHGVDVEGKRLGIDEELVMILGHHSPIPVTYAGGVTAMEDLEKIKIAGSGRVDVTVGSALDIFGGSLPYRDVVAWHRSQYLVT